MPVPMSAHRPTTRSRGTDVFGDITMPLRNGHSSPPRLPSPVSLAKGKGVVRDYGDR